jgi:hypothetical protein
MQAFVTRRALLEHLLNDHFWDKLREDIPLVKMPFFDKPE